MMEILFICLCINRGMRKKVHFKATVQHFVRLPSVMTDDHQSAQQKFPNIELILPLAFVYCKQGVSA